MIPGPFHTESNVTHSIQYKVYLIDPNRTDVGFSTASKLNKLGPLHQRAPLLYTIRISKLELLKDLISFNDRCTRTLCHHDALWEKIPVPDHSINGFPVDILKTTGIRRIKCS